MNPQALPLKDIHLPDAVSWWPLAPIWWVIIGLLVVTPLAIWWLQRWRKGRLVVFVRERMQQICENYIDHQDNGQFFSDVSVLLRQTMMTLQPRRQSASLTGEAWLKQLDQMGDTNAFSEGPGKLMISAPYQANTQENIDEIAQLVNNWIQQACAKKQPRRAEDVYL